VVVAAAARGEGGERFAPVLDRLATSRDKRDLLALAYTAPRLTPDRALSYLLPLVEKSSSTFKEIKPDCVLQRIDLIPLRGCALPEDKFEDVRLAAYQGLAGIQVVDPGKQKLVENAFRSGLYDSSIKVQVFSAGHLMNTGNAEVASILYQQLKKYIEDPLNPQNEGQKVMVDHEALELRANNFYDRNKMETEVTFQTEDGKNGDPITLKRMALLAFAQFNGPSEAMALLPKMLHQETEEFDLLLTAQAMVVLSGPNALGPIIDRLKKGAPDRLFEYALQVMQVGNVTELAPLAYGLMLHRSARVRSAAAWTLKNFDSDGFLQTLLEDSHQEDPPRTPENR